MRLLPTISLAVLLLGTSLCVFAAVQQDDNCSSLATLFASSSDIQVNAQDPALFSNDAARFSRSNDSSSTVTDSFVVWKFSSAVLSFQLSVFVETATPTNVPVVSVSTDGVAFTAVASANTFVQAASTYWLEYKVTGNVPTPAVYVKATFPTCTLCSPLSPQIGQALFLVDNAPAASSSAPANSNAPSATPAVSSANPAPATSTADPAVAPSSTPSQPPSSTAVAAPSSTAPSSTAPMQPVSSATQASSSAAAPASSTASAPTTTAPSPPRVVTFLPPAPGAPSASNYAYPTARNPGYNGDGSGRDYDQNGNTSGAALPQALSTTLLVPVCIAAMLRVREWLQ